MSLKQKIKNYSTNLRVGKIRLRRSRTKLEDFDDGGKVMDDPEDADKNLNNNILSH